MGLSGGATVLKSWSRKASLKSCALRTGACSQLLSHVQLFWAQWTIAHQASLSVGFSRQEYWSRLPFPPPGDFSDPGIEPVSLAFPALAGRFFTTSTTWETQEVDYLTLILGKFSYIVDKFFTFVFSILYFWMPC